MTERPATSALSVVHVTPWVGAHSFGVGAVPLNLAVQQRRLGVEATVWCTDGPEDISWASRSSGLSVEAIRSFGHFGPKRLAYSPRMERGAEDGSAPGVAVVHQHGIWHATSRVVGIFRRRVGIPTVLAAHGSLQQWVQRRSKVKKWVAALAYERGNLVRASCLHACALREVRDYRDYGLSNAIAVIPNGISEAWIQSTGDAHRFREAHGIPGDKHVLLFLSRIAPVKGLSILLQAMADIRRRLGGWLLVIAGADERGHESAVRRLVEDLGLGRYVRFVGPQYEQGKRDAYAAADVFVLPSLGESSPLVVLEALGAAVPVLTTSATPWAELDDHACGWCAEPTPEGLAQGLRSATALGGDALKGMGERGRKLVSEAYSWSRSAAMTVRLYDWLRDCGDRPEFVILD